MTPCRLATNRPSPLWIEGLPARMVTPPEAGGGAGAGAIRANVKAADATLWLGRSDTPDGRVAAAACLEAGRPFFVAVEGVKASVVATWIVAGRVRVLHVLGNRASEDPEI